MPNLCTRWSRVHCHGRIRLNGLLTESLHHKLPWPMQQLSIPSKITEKFVNFIMKGCAPMRGITVFTNTFVATVLSWEKI